MYKARLAVSIIFFINGFAFANWISRLPRFQEQYDMDNGVLGMVLLMHAVGALLSMPVAGWLIVRNGSRKVTSVSAIVFISLIPFLPMMPNMYFLGFWYLLIGASVGILDVAMNAQAVFIEKEMKKPIMSSFHAVFSGGMMVGAVAGAFFTSVEVNLIVHLTIIIGICVPLSIWSINQLVLDDIDRAKVTDEPSFRLPDRRLLGIGLLAFCGMLGEGAMADWSTNYLEKIAFAKEAIAPLGLSAFATAMMIGRIFGDWAREQFGDDKLLIAGSLVAITGLSLTIVWIAVPVIIFGFFLIGLGLATVVPIAYSIAGNVKGIAPGLGISMVTTIGYSGFLFGPPIIGFVADWQTLRIAFILVLFLFLMMLVLSFRNAKKVQG